MCVFACVCVCFIVVICVCVFAHVGVHVCKFLYLILCDIFVLDFVCRCVEKCYVCVCVYVYSNQAVSFLPAIQEGIISHLD